MMIPRTTKRCCAAEQACSSKVCFLITSLTHSNPVSLSRRAIRESFRPASADRIAPVPRRTVGASLANRRAGPFVDAVLSDEVGAVADGG